MVNRILEDSLEGKDDWYKRYPAYPPYCSAPEEMSKRRIPPLRQPSPASAGRSRLVHVTAIVRHGARTPWTGDLKCWENYTSLDSDTGVWDCNLTTVIAPPSPRRVDAEEGEERRRNGTEAMFLFEKRYDALTQPKFNLSNQLRGTCQTGQLILQGYEQEYKNGQILRDAYAYHGDNDTEHDPRMRLIDVSTVRVPPANGTVRDYQLPWRRLYYRADDDQRTLMSGQVLLRGMMEPEIEYHYAKTGAYPVLPLHTADRGNDVVDPNEKVCERMAEIRELFEGTAAFKSYNESVEARTLRSFQRAVLNIEPDMDAIDCLMTTICTDRTLHPAVNDYKGEEDGGGAGRRFLLGAESTVETGSAGAGTGRTNSSRGDDSSSESTTSSLAPTGDYGTDLFRRLFDFAVRSYTLLYAHNNSEYAKTGMGPLWAEILVNIRGVLDNRTAVCCPERATPKVALFSGHDTTLMPLLASLGGRVFDGKWPPYASMMVVEIHEISTDGNSDSETNSTNYAFRLIFNGEVRTHFVDGCLDDADLCDVQVLLSQVEQFATKNRNCARQEQQGSLASSSFISSTSYQVDLSSPTGVAALALLMIGCALFGALCSYLCMVHGRYSPDAKYNMRRDRKRVLQADGDDAEESHNGIQPYDGTFA